MVEIRPEVSKFAEQMEIVLRRNDYKGGWHNEPKEFFDAKLREEVFELKCALFLQNFGEHANGGSVEDREVILNEAVDVANIVMMIADNWGGLMEAGEADRVHICAIPVTPWYCPKCGNQILYKLLSKDNKSNTGGR